MMHCEIEQDQAKAEADQAYNIQEVRSRKKIVEEQMQIEIVRIGREIDLEEKENLRRERQYDAEVKKKADADRYAVEQAAEAEKSKQMREAEAKARAAQIRLDWEAVDASERAKGTADAEVIRLRGLAEAEAFQKFGEATVLDIIVKMLPELASKVAEPLKSIDKLTVVDTGNGAGAGRVSNYVTELMATAPEMLKSVSGLDFEQLVKQFTMKEKVEPVIEVKKEPPKKRG